MTRWLQTDINTDLDISDATLIGSYTADADRLVIPQLLIDQAAGNGDYVYYVTLQVNGAGSFYVLGPKITHTAASEETAIGAQGAAVAVRSGDVVRVYVDGLPEDIRTPDTIVRWFEFEPVRQALATELARIDAAVSSRLATASYAAPLDASGTRLAVGMAAANLDAQLDALPTAAEIVAAIDAAPPAVNVTKQAGEDLAAPQAGYPLVIPILNTMELPS